MGATGVTGAYAEAGSSNSAPGARRSPADMRSAGTDSTVTHHRARLEVSHWRQPGGPGLRARLAKPLWWQVADRWRMLDHLVDADIGLHPPVFGLLVDLGRGVRRFGPRTHWPERVGSAGGRRQCDHGAGGRAVPHRARCTGAALRVLTLKPGLVGSSDAQSSGRGRGSAARYRWSPNGCRPPVLADRSPARPGSPPRSGGPPPGPGPGSRPPGSLRPPCPGHGPG
jgi:hypothetical protein